MNGTRHGTTEELLALRDGEGGAWVKAHVGSCGACEAELYRLEQVRARLRALPTFSPPRDRWAVVAERARVERRSGRWRFGRWLRQVRGGGRPTTNVAAPTCTTLPAMGEARAIRTSKGNLGAANGPGKP